ncbi:glucokinase [Granulicatella balaenopterae]|uniref:Glucokinase n=1 Tax=Granulicatella balaenopterae TaxID=137733 RepID=A0A1H9KDH5_9LACT|nr:ROK family protein [Granulicatella balaenopterae]SEQ97159.1 glucokinase [Granulicatella balaenopterae]
MKLLTFDVGGTSVKYGICDNGQIDHHGIFPTPITIEEFYEQLVAVFESIICQHIIKGVAFSCPGAVNQKTGIIEGCSAVPYIHDFPIKDKFEELFQLPVTIENDANCAALAEVNFGNAKGCENAILLVLGTGVGGSIIINGKVYHGSHLFGGEFGFMAMNDELDTFSALGTVVNMAKRYNDRIPGVAELSGKDILALADQGAEMALEERKIFIKSVARSIFNLQHAIDPEVILIGGGVSNYPLLLPLIQEELDTIYQKLTHTTLYPTVKLCQFKNDANLIGAYVNFLQQK